MKINFQLTPKQQQIAGVGVVLLGVGGYLYITQFWSPITKKINENTQETEKINRKIEDARREAKRLEVLEKELLTLEFQAKDAEKRLPPTRDLPTVLDTVARLARRYKVEVSNFAPGAVSTKTYFIEIPYQIVISGKYHDVGRFLAAISVEERIYNLKDISFTVLNAEDKKLNVNFTLLAYQYKG